MRKRTLTVAFGLCLLAGVALAQTINNLGSGTTLTGSELIPMFQSANPAVTTTPAALKTYVLTGPIYGVVTSQSGTTYTFASTDCGTEVLFTSNSAVTATIPATLSAGCNISVAQLGTAKVSVNGSAVAAATLHSAHSYTGTSAQYAVIGVNIATNSGGSSAVALLTGDGS